MKLLHREIMFIGITICALFFYLGTAFINNINYPLVSCQNQLSESILATDVDWVDILPEDEICNVWYDHREYFSRVLYEHSRELENIYYDYNNEMCEYQDKKYLQSK